MVHLSGIERMPQDRLSAKPRRDVFKLLVFKETFFRTLAEHNLKEKSFYRSHMERNTTSEKVDWKCH